jgi:hypothetical protein
MNDHQETSTIVTETARARGAGCAVVGEEGTILAAE